MQGKRNGFTLIEMMLVVAIVGILAVTAVPNWLRYQRKMELRKEFTKVEKRMGLGVPQLCTSSWKNEKGNNRQK